VRLDIKHGARRLSAAVVLVTALTAAHSVLALTPAYQYRAPDGSVVFTDTPLAPPFVLVKQLELTWGERKARIVEARSYRVPISRAPASTKHTNLNDQIIETAEKYHLLPELLHAVIEVESAYNPEAVSHAGAVGLMQLMPATAERFGVTDRTDPGQSLDGGAQYLRFLLDHFHNDLMLALAGYNAGENAVKKYNHTIPPYAETRGYVAKVLKLLRRNLVEKRGRKRVAATTLVAR